MTAGEHAHVNHSLPARRRGYRAQPDNPAGQSLTPPFGRRPQAVLLGTLMVTLLAGCGEGSGGSSGDAANTPKAAATSATGSAAAPEAGPDSSANTGNAASPITRQTKAEDDPAFPTTEADDPPLPTADDAPFNTNGITGELLAAMFDAWSDRGTAAAALPPYASAIQADQSDTPQPNPLADSAIPRISVQQRLVGNQYLDGKTEGSYSPAVGNFTYQMKAGAWLDEKRPTATLPLHSGVELALSVTNSRNGNDGTLVLSRNISVTPQIASGSNRTGMSVDLPMDWVHFDESSSFGHKERVPYYQYLEPHLEWWHSWQSAYSPAAGPDGTVSMYVRKPKEANRPEFCWEFNLHVVDRSIYRKVCTTWEVPQNWTYGQPLKPVRQVVTDHAWLGSNSPYPQYRDFAWSTSVR